MYNILSSKNQRFIRILEHLATNQSWTTIPSLANKLNYSYQVLREDINDINVIFSPFEIEASQKYGIRLLIPSGYTVSFFYQKILIESIELQLLEAIFFKDSFTYASLGDSLFISISTVTRLINRINRHLLPFNFSISTFPSTIIGEEKSIRLVFMNYFLEKYSFHEIPFSHSQIRSVEKLIMIFNSNLNVTQFHKLKLFILVSLIRIKKGFRREKLTVDTIAFNSFKNKIICDKQLVRELSTSFTCTFDESILLELFHFFFQPELITLQKLKSPVAYSLATQLSPIYSLINSLEDEFNITAQNTNELLCDLYNLKFQFIDHDYFLHNKKRRFVQIVKEQYPDHINVLETVIMKSNIYTSNKNNNNFFIELLYIIITHWKNLTGDVKKNMKKINIGIFGEFDKQHSLYLADLMTYYFSKLANITIIDDLSSETAEKSPKSFDLIISTLATIKWQAKHIFIINLAPSAEDFKKLDSIILELASKANLTHY